MEIYWNNGTSSTNIHQFIKNETHDNVLLYWIEPIASIANRPINNDKYINCFTEIFPKDIVLEQIRVFYKNGILHAIANGSKCRWFKCFEVETLECEKIETSEFHREQVTTRDKNVFLRQDYKRFGIEHLSHKKGKINIRQYYRNDQLFTWRII